jgi:hypothetical protein
LLALALLLVAGSAPLAAKTYTAETYDVRIQVLDDGLLRITETIVLHFEEGTFREFFREIPVRRTDGLEFVSASLDGRELPWGDGVGQVERSGRSERRVRWRFGPVENAQHMFSVTYLVRGAIRQTDDADLLVWRAVPEGHDYSIGSSAIAVETPAALAGDPNISTRRVGATSIVPSARGVTVSATDIDRNGWVQLNLRFARGALIAEPPAWQRARLEAQASAPWWAAGGFSLLVLSLIPFIALRTRYPAPPADLASVRGDVRQPPGPEPPAVAGALFSNGKTHGAHAMATLFDLARRGAVTITQTKRSRFSRSFEVRRRPGHHRLSEVEQRVLDVAFTKKGQSEEVVELSKAASRLAGKTRPVRDAVRRQLEHDELWHPDRAHSRRQYGGAATLAAIAGGLALVPAILLADRYLGWPLLLPAGLFVSAIVGLVLMESLTSLSDRGLRQSARWKVYRAHLKDVARGRADVEAGARTTWLPLAVALGLGAAWASHLKKHPDEMPPWFQGWTPEDGSAAFAAMIAGASAGSGGGGSGGAGAGAAGGGASGAS